MKRRKVVNNPDLRDLGKNIAKIAEMPEGRTFLGQIYLAACGDVDRTRSYLEMDRQLVRAFAGRISATIDRIGSSWLNGYEKQIHKDAVSFLKSCHGPLSVQSIRMPRPQSLFEMTRERAEESGISYHDAGRKIDMSSDALTDRLKDSSEDLRKKLPQVNKYDLEQAAIRILKNYLDH